MPLSPCAYRRAGLPLSVLLATLVAGCGSESTAPGDKLGGKPGINVVAGANVTDTIGAPLPLALKVIVRDTAGRIMPGAVVRFSSVPVQRRGVTPCPACSWAA